MGCFCRKYLDPRHVFLPVRAGTGLRLDQSVRHDGPKSRSRGSRQPRRTAQLIHRAGSAHRKPLRQCDKSQGTLLLFASSCLRFVCSYLCGNIAVLFQETLVLSYSPDQPTVYNRYYPTSKANPQRSKIGGQKQARSTFEPLLQEPECKSVRLLTNLTAHSHQGLIKAVGEIGGINVFLFLLAKVGFVPVCVCVCVRARARAQRK